ncbi:MAG: hypothetical protein H6718_03180 [Polyangiaceae bacterium]|nr:hypothetical protein [Myxococcales bacterium]MCB9584369.1 hypothetical protein [Polyangiaceae bacterium]
MADRKPEVEEPCDSCGKVVELESHGGTMTEDNKWLCTWCAEDRGDPHVAMFEAEAEAFALANCRVTAAIAPFDSSQGMPSRYQLEALNKCTNHSVLHAQLCGIADDSRRKAYRRAVSRRLCSMVDFANTGDRLVLHFEEEPAAPGAIEAEGVEVLPLLKGGDHA